MTQYNFVPPTVDETPMGGHRLFERYKLARGIAVLRTNGVYSSYREPSQVQVREAEEIYLGGHIYVIEQATATALQAAGYSAYVTAI